MWKAGDYTQTSQERILSRSYFLVLSLQLTLVPHWLLASVLYVVLSLPSALHPSSCFHYHLTVVLVTDSAYTMLWLFCVF